MGRYVALLRGINVGKAKRVAMADLRALVSGLGYGEVATWLNSGNVVFSAPRGSAAMAATRIEAALASELGMTARVTGISAADLASAVAENPLGTVATNHSRLLVAFLATPADRAKLALFAQQRWDPEALALGPRVAYMWCPDGILASPLATALGHALRDGVTSRNWTTVTKLLALAEA